MARPPRAAAGSNSNVFINCPFDDEYLPCFEALLFAITVSGYRVRCALEDNDAGDIRFEKLKRLIRESDHTIHDLCRVELNQAHVPRFNMPFELGVMMGAKAYGGPAQRRKRACIMIAAQFALPASLSDLAGNDPAHHDNDPDNVIAIVRDFLHCDPDGRLLPGADAFIRVFQIFNRDLPDIAQRARLAVPRDTHARLSYRNFMALLEGFCDSIKGLEDIL